MTDQEPARLNILTVEDDPTVLKLYSTLFTKEGYKHTVAMTGKEGVERIQDEHFDLICLDLKLPDMDGIDLLRKIKDKIEWIPVIILTANPTLESSILAVNAGIVTEYIVKPFDTKELMFTINKAVDKAKLAIENRRLIKKLAKSNQALSQRVEELESLVEENLKAHSEVSKLKEYVIELEGKLKTARGKK